MIRKVSPVDSDWVIIISEHLCMPASFKDSDTEYIVGLRYSEGHNNLAKTEGYDDKKVWRFSGNKAVKEKSDEVNEDTETYWSLIL